MRKLVASFFISLDGVYEGPGPMDDFKYAGWTMPFWNDEIGDYADAAMATADTMLLGRKTYLAFEAAFASSNEGNAATMNAFKRYVVSTTLKETTWGDTTIISDDVIEQVRALKAQPGRDIGMSGSGQLVGTVLEHGLIDELNLLVYPVVLGEGKRLFTDGMFLNLELVASRPLGPQVVALTYRSKRA